MRVDLFLKTSRLILRRSLAQEFCDRGLIKINGVKAKSSRDVKAGDEIEIRMGNRLLTARILEIPAIKQVSKSAASELYETISEETFEDSPF